jgi:sulfide:quinone oxidoreductase
MRRVLILGGGFGGISTAHRLRELMGADVEIVLVDRRSSFVMGFRKTSAIVGREPLADVARPLDALAAKDVRVVRGTVERIDPATHSAVVDGEAIDADALVVALGADLAPNKIPGLAEHGINVYSTDGVEPAAEALRTLDDGRLVVGIFGVPYKCPAAPYELAILCADALQERGSRATVHVFTPQPGSLPVVGTAGCAVIEGRLGERGISFRANAKPERVEPGRVIVASGGLPLEDEEIPFDVLFGVPPHVCPKIVVDAGLAQPGGWVTVDPRTLETSIDGVYAIGDVTVIPMANGQPMPKAGAFADAEGRVVAERIAARFAGGSSDAAFDGAGACFLETGGGEAMIVQGNFLTSPAPSVELSPSSAENLAAKDRFERERLDSWFATA